MRLGRPAVARIKACLLAQVFSHIHIAPPSQSTFLAYGQGQRRKHALVTAHGNTAWPKIDDDDARVFGRRLHIDRHGGGGGEFRWQHRAGGRQRQYRFGAQEPRDAVGLSSSHVARVDSIHVGTKSCWLPRAILVGRRPMTIYVWKRLANVLGSRFWHGLAGFETACINVLNDLRPAESVIIGTSSDSNFCGAVAAVTQVSLHWCLGSLIHQATAVTINLP